MFAVFKSGGKQHRVSEGEVVRLELIDSEPGSSLTFVHALNAAGRSAFCVDLPAWTGGEDIWSAQLRLAGKTLSVVAASGKTFARIDTATLLVMQ